MAILAPVDSPGFSVLLDETVVLVGVDAVDDDEPVLRIMKIGSAFAVGNTVLDPMTPLKMPAIPVEHSEWFPVVTRPRLGRSPKVESGLPLQYAPSNPYPLL